MAFSMELAFLVYYMALKFLTYSLVLACFDIQLGVENTGIAILHGNALLLAFLGGFSSVPKFGW